MDHSFSGGSWNMIPTMPTHGNISTPPNQDHLFLQQQQQQQFHQFQSPQQQFQHQQQQQFQSPPQQQQFQSPPQQQQQFQSPPQQQQFQSPPQQQFQQQQQQRVLQQQQQQQQLQQHQSLASHFHLLHLVESLSEAIDNGTRDQHSDALIGVKVSELKNNFDKCQQLLNSIAGSISSKAMTVEGQKRKLEETEQMLNQRRDLIAKYSSSVDELIKSEP